MPKLSGLFSASAPPTPALIALDRGRPDCEGERINITILQRLFFHAPLCIQMDLCGGEVIASNMWLTILTLRETAALACSQLNGHPSGRVIFSTSAMLFSSHTALREIWLGSVQSFSLSLACSSLLFRLLSLLPASLSSPSFCQTGKKP